MKCEIIRDLMPLHLDGLTSEESDQAIKEHLNGCEPCKEILEQMTKETEVKPEEVKKRINPFRKFNRKMKAYIAATLAVCVAFGGLGYKVFAQGFAIDPDDMTMDVRMEGEMLYLDFALEEGVLQHDGTMYDETSAEVKLRRVWTLPGDYLGTEPNKFSWGMQVDAVTIGSGELVEVQMTDAGGLTVMEISDGEGVTIQNGEAGPTTIMMFHEGDEAVGMTFGNEGPMEDFTVTVDYGKETMTYTLLELREMAEK
ncbi:MAG: zf-HC2 domain-containing protein [Anaerotignum sp.]|nr:zf-HC2 domain-containing protein [Anaerotignum sp.]